MKQKGTAAYYLQRFLHQLRRAAEIWLFTSRTIEAGRVLSP
jgi:hypothetical protein